MEYSYNEIYMLMAQSASLYSTCLSRKVGCIIVTDNGPVAYGYNGPAENVELCEDLGGCQRRLMPDYESGKYLEICPAVHAEANAIAMAARKGIKIYGATIYVNTFPCKDCMNLIIASGIKKVIYNSKYNADLSWKIAQKVGIELVQYDGRDYKEVYELNKTMIRLFCNSYFPHITDRLEGEKPKVKTLIK